MFEIFFLIPVLIVAGVWGFILMNVRKNSKEILDDDVLSNDEKLLDDAKSSMRIVRFMGILLILIVAVFAIIAVNSLHPFIHFSVIGFALAAGGFLFAYLGFALGRLLSGSKDNPQDKDRNFAGKALMISFMTSGIIVMIIGIIVCISEPKTQAVKEDFSKAVRDELAKRAAEEEAESPEEIPQEISADEPEILKFVDVFGEEYEVEINPNIPKQDYDNGAFHTEGSGLAYDDAKYTSRFGIDVSKHQGDIDWETVKAQGVDFAFVRIGYRGYGEEGNINLDQKFYQNIEGAQAAGIHVGVYFFSQAINEEEAIEEANFVINALEGYDLQMPVVYDPESILDDVARTDDVSGEQFTKNAVAFCDVIKENGFWPMVYSNMLWEAYELNLTQLPNIPVWYADYEPYPQTPYYFSVWQYTNEGTLEGIDGPVDLNIELLIKQ